MEENSKWKLMYENAQETIQSLNDLCQCLATSYDLTKLKYQETLKELKELKERILEESKVY